MSAKTKGSGEKASTVAMAGGAFLAVGALALFSIFRHNEEARHSKSAEPNADDYNFAGMLIFTALLGMFAVVGFGFGKEQ